MQKRVKELLEAHLGFKNILIEKPKECTLGHFATPMAFSLAKEERKNPNAIAQELAQKLSGFSEFESIEAVGGYINFRLSVGFLNELASDALKAEGGFGKGEKGQKILLEFVSANPTGPLHIGHARGAVFGDALLKIGKHLGYDIDSEYYINDAGNQINLLGVSLYLAGREHILKFPVEYPEQYYKGGYIIDLAQEIYQKYGDVMFLDEINIEKLSEIGKELMLEEIKSNLKAVGIEFDNLVSERSLYDRWESVASALKEHGGLYEKDGKLWLNSTEYGDEKDRVVVRENGEPTYLAGDIIYHADKFSRHYDRYINIWGADHHGYIARVKASVRHLGYDEGRLEIVLSQMVSLLKGGEPYKMSKRAGNFILMRDVVEDIGAEALRFIFLAKKSDTHLEFDVDELSKQDSSNPIFYINYAHARICNILEKSRYSPDEIKTAEIRTSNEDAKNLLFSALQLPQVLSDTFEARQPNKLTDYLKFLAAELHRFYFDHKVIDSDNEKEHLKILLLVALSLRVGFSLLGIEAKRKM